MRPRFRSYAESSTLILSPGRMRMRWRRIFPAVYPSVSWPFSRAIRYMPFRNASTTSPSSSIFSSLPSAIPLLRTGSRGAGGASLVGVLGGAAQCFDHAVHREPLERLRFDLPDALTCQPEPATDLVERLRIVVAVESIA